MPRPQSVFTALLLPLVLVAVAMVRGNRATGLGPFWNTGYVYAGAQCLTARTPSTRCDPYLSVSLDAAERARTEKLPSLSSDSLVYPPGTLLLAVPLTALPWPAAGLVLDLLSCTAFTLACFFCLRLFHASLLSPASLLVLAATSTRALPVALSLANPVVLASALALIACLLPLGPAGSSSTALPRPHPYWRQAMAALLLALALLLKPQIALGPLLFLLWQRGTRRTAFQAAGAAALCSLGAMVLFRFKLGSFAFLHHFLANVGQSLALGEPSDSSPANPASVHFLNLQALLLRLPGVGSQLARGLAFAGAAAVLCAALGLAARYQLPALNTSRQPRIQAPAVPSCRPSLMLALFTIATMLPEYHRGYDRVAVLLLLPATAVLQRHRPALAWLLATVATLWMSAELLADHARLHLDHVALSPLIELALAAILLFSLRAPVSNVDLATAHSPIS